MLRAAFALAACLVATGCSPAQATVAPDTTAQFTAADDAAIRGVLEAQRDAWNAGDLEGYMAGYEHSDALVFTSGGNIRRGWQETHDKYAARYGGDSSTMGHLEFELHEVRPLGADGAVVLGHWYLTETPESGSGVFSVVFLRTAEGWKVVHDHTSASAPETPTDQGPASTEDGLDEASDAQG